MATSPITTTSATDAQGQLLMVAQGLQAAENARNAANATVAGFVPTNNVNISPDLDALTVSITATLPIEVSLTANGVTFVATDYLA